MCVKDLKWIWTNCNWVHSTIGKGLKIKKGFSFSAFIVVLLYAFQNLESK